MTFECRREAGQTTLSGFAADADVGDGMRIMLGLQALLEQHRPAFFADDAVGGRETIAGDQDDRRRGRFGLGFGICTG